MNLRNGTKKIMRLRYATQYMLNSQYDWGGRGENKYDISKIYQTNDYEHDSLALVACFIIYEKWAARRNHIHLMHVYLICNDKFGLFFSRFDVAHSRDTVPWHHKMYMVLTFGHQGSPTSDQNKKPEHVLSCECDVWTNLSSINYSKGHWHPRTTSLVFFMVDD